MEMIKQGRNFDHRHIWDVRRLKIVLFLNGYTASLEESAELWQDLSDSLSAGWLSMPDSDEDLWEEIRTRAKESL